MDRFSRRVDEYVVPAAEVFWAERIADVLVNKYYWVGGITLLLA